MKFRLFSLYFSPLFLIGAIAGLAFLGTFTRFHADDFCMARDATLLGLPGMLVRWYTNWTGRFMFILGTGLLGLGGPIFAGWLPALVSGIWLAGMAWSVYPLFKRLGWPKPLWQAVVAAALALLVLLSSIPNLFQSFLWQDGMVNYTLPLMGLTLTGGMLLRVWLEQSRLLPACAMLFGLSFINGGFTEAFSAMQVVFFTLILLVAFSAKDRATRSRLAKAASAALLGSLMAVLVVILAPGNTVRLQAVGSPASHPGLVRILTFSMRNMVFIFGKYFLRTPIWALVSIFPSFLSGWLFSNPARDSLPGWSLRFLWEQGWEKALVLVPGAAMLLVTAACAPVVYALNAYPDDRTIMIPQFILVCAVIVSSALLGAGLKHLKVLHDPGKSVPLCRPLQVRIIAAMLLASGFSLTQTARQIPVYQSNAIVWDKRAAILQTAASSGQKEVTVPVGYSLFGVADLSEDPNNWINRCVAEYYHIPNILGRKP